MKTNDQHNPVLRKKIKRLFSLMTYRYLLTTFILTAGSLSGFAQKDFVVSLKAESLVLPNRGFYIDSVVDARSLVTNIGMAQVGMNNRQVEAQLDKPFEQAIATYFETTLPPKNGQRRIIAVVNELRISEKTYKMKERGLAEVDITFCRLDSGKLYKLYTVTKQEESGGMDVSAGHPRRLATALNECVKEFNLSDYRTNLGTPFESDLSWHTTDPERNILLCSNRIPGIYQKFSQLRSNSPQKEKVLMEPRGILFMVRDSESKARLREPFGICDGRFLYINTYFYNVSAEKGMFAKVIEEGRILAWYDHYMSGTEAGFAAGGFGVVGQTIAASGIDIIGLDLKTGVIKPIKRKSLEELLAEDPELLARYQEKRDKGDVTVMMEFLKLFNERNKL
jgi:hypothetical protein